MAEREEEKYDVLEKIGMYFSMVLCHIYAWDNTRKLTGRDIC